VRARALFLRPTSPNLSGFQFNHATFEEYCQKRWDMARRTAYQLMDAADVIDNVRNCAHQIPSNEAQARELAPYEKQVQQAVFLRAHAFCGCVSPVNPCRDIG
jgi:hypothetical protein